MRGAQFVEASLDELSEIAAKYIEVSSQVIRKALEVNRPNPDAIRNQAAMDQVIGLMIERGYIDRPLTRYKNLSFLNKAAAPRDSSTPACCGS